LTNSKQDTGQNDRILQQIEEYSLEFAERHLKEYTERIERSDCLSQSPKEVNDALWGTIKLTPLEVAIIDSPLLQRLRFVRQLGVVHWVYPGAVHTRFEHTLGVLYQVQQIVTAINEAAPDTQTPISPYHAAVLRLAAVVHDVG